jgi:casein kinase I family protein HRR25
MGLESARRDDLESLAYVLLYFLRGSLPWQNLEASIKYNDYTPVLEKKRSMPTDVLCHGFPNEFATFLDYSRSLKFDAKPDYAYLRRLFSNLCTKQGYDSVFDWTTMQIIGGVRGEDCDHHTHEDMSSGTKPTQKVKEPPTSDRKYDYFSPILSS